MAARAGFISTVQVLLHAGARTEISNREGKKPVELALDSATRNLLKKQ